MKNKIYFKFIIFFFFCIFFYPAEYCHSESVKHQYFKAERSYADLKKSSTDKKYRSNWIKCIDKYEKAYKTSPGDPWSPAAMFKSGQLYFELADVSFLKSDIDTGINTMRRLIKRYPGSRYKFKALKSIKENKPKLHSKKYISKDSNDPVKNILKDKHPTANKPDKPTKPEVIYSKIDTDQKHNSSDQADNIINKIRFHTHDNRTRIVVDSDNEINYDFNDLNKDNTHKKPPRIYIDFKNSTLADDIDNKYNIKDKQVENVRIARYTKDTVRLVVDLKHDARDFKVFSLFKPYRTVVDIWGGSHDAGDIKNHPKVAKNVDTDKIDNSNADSLVRQLALGVKKIVIDPGHGGKDYGAPGYYKGSHEKYVVMGVAKKLAKKIKNEFGYEVVLTRDNDKYLSLEKRTELANTNRADLFISLHTNAARNKNAYGIETYFLNLATDESSISVAARENATSTKNISDLQTILNDLMRDAKINESSRLASYIQEGMVGSLKNKFSYINDRGVKQAPFYVLLGARMPAVLVEMSFISNPRECKRLNSDAYQEEVCNGIMKGIRKYLKENGARAYMNSENSENNKG
ncbi:MAG: N-acetylmuramoyl-L-alanine amidase [Thermodesulfobacteriota bacterium]